MYAYIYMYTYVYIYIYILTYISVCFLLVYSCICLEIQNDLPVPGTPFVQRAPCPATKVLLLPAQNGISPYLLDPPRQQLAGESGAASCFCDPSSGAL